MSQEAEPTVGHSVVFLKFIVRDLTGYGKAYVELIPGLGTRKSSDEFSKGHHIK